MKAYSIIVGTVLLFTIACNKDKKTTEEEIIEGIGWKAKQEVRILKVEQKQRHWAIPFEAAENVVVKYFYDEIGEISKITYSNLENTDYYIHNWTKSSNGYIMSGFEYPAPNSFLCLKNNIHIFENENIKYIEGDYGQIFPTSGGLIIGDFYRYANFTYTTLGLLSEISSVFEYSNVNEIDTSFYYIYSKSIEEIIFSKNAINSFRIKNKISESLKEDIEYENYKVNVSYSPAKEVPDGLRRLVNQSILGLSPMGMEEGFNNPEYINDSRSALNPTVSSSVFVDWIYSFACPQIQSIPAQGVGLVSQKQIKGKRVSHVDNELPMPYIFTEVDSTANFPYIHDATAKTLEIAGLKIYYELVE